MEEYAFRLYDVFPPARFLSGLVSADHRIGFIILNAGFFALGIAVYLGLVRPGRPSAIPWMWGWAVVEVANGMAHVAISAIQRAYLPGTLTAPVFVVGLYLGLRLRQESVSVVR